MRKKRTTMEGSERSHLHRSSGTAGGASDFFICFTARPSSSSAASSSAAMRIPSSKALMSPGRARDPSSAPALSASLSRRLRNSGSVKGGQSPMFPSGVQIAGRKKGCSFEAAEPSSPKVTCIGQVRVKAKKKVNSKAKAAMARSTSQRGRECCPGQNQSWVHQFHLSICESLRGICSEFSCFLPCGGRSLCSSDGSYSATSRTAVMKGRDERIIGRSGSSSSCGAVLAKWLLAVQETEEEVKEGEKVEVGVLLRERDEKVAEADIEELGTMGGENREILVMGEKGESGEEEAAMVSVCIPPRNALLLMRCRSDPVRMAALANRFWGSPANKPPCEEEQVTEEDNEVEEEVQGLGRTHSIKEPEDPLKKGEGDAVEISVVSGELVNDKNDHRKNAEEEDVLIEEKFQLLEEAKGSARVELPCGSPSTLQMDQPKVKPNGETLGLVEQEEVEASGRSYYLPEKEEEKTDEKTKGSRVNEERTSGTICASRYKERVRRHRNEKGYRRRSFSSEVDTRRRSFSSEREARRSSFSIDRSSRWSFSIEMADLEPKGMKSLSFSAEVVCPEEKMKQATQEEKHEEEGEAGRKIRRYGESEKLVRCCSKYETEVEDEKKGVAGEFTELPDCLLMMMYEPKLSMEVSKETWVCSNDFLRWRPQHSRNHVPSKPDVIVQAAGNNVAVHPPESVSIEPAASAIPLPEPPKVTATQHRLSARPATVAPYEPLVLTRCKSEPMRSSARLTPDACFWKDRHRPVGAAGIGF